MYELPGTALYNDAHGLRIATVDAHDRVRFGAITLQRDLGMALSPFNAFLFLQGLETLPMRMREHARNAEAVAQHLRTHPAITRVIWPGFAEGEFVRRAKTYLKGGFGGLRQNAARSQARKAAEQTLGTIKQALEAAVP